MIKCFNGNDIGLVMECQKLLLQIIAALYYSGALLASQFSNKVISILVI